MMTRNVHPMLSIFNRGECDDQIFLPIPYLNNNFCLSPYLKRGFQRGFIKTRECKTCTSWFEVTSCNVLSPPFWCDVKTLIKPSQLLTKGRIEIDSQHVHLPLRQWVSYTHQNLWDCPFLCDIVPLFEHTIDLEHLWACKTPFRNKNYFIRTTSFCRKKVKTISYGLVKMKEKEGNARNI